MRPGDRQAARASGRRLPRPGRARPAPGPPLRRALADRRARPGRRRRADRPAGRPVLALVRRRDAQGRRGIAARPRLPVARGEPDLRFVDRDRLEGGPPPIRTRSTGWSSARGGTRRPSSGVGPSPRPPWASGRCSPRWPRSGRGVRRRPPRRRPVGSASRRARRGCSGSGSCGGCGRRNAPGPRLASSPGWPTDRPPREAGQCSRRCATETSRCWPGRARLRSGRLAAVRRAPVPRLRADRVDARDRRHVAGPDRAAAAGRLCRRRARRPLGPPPDDGGRRPGPRRRAAAAARAGRDRRALARLRGRARAVRGWPDVRTGPVGAGAIARAGRTAWPPPTRPSRRATS